MIYHPVFAQLAAARLTADQRRLVDVDDVLQQAYTRAFSSITDLRGAGPEQFINWVLTTIDRELIDLHRWGKALKRDAARETRPAPPGDSFSGSFVLLDAVCSCTPTPSRILRKDEAVQRVAGAMNELTAIQREVLELRYLHGLSVQQTAQRMDRTEGAVAAITLRALHALRDRMGPEWFLPSTDSL